MRPSGEIVSITSMESSMELNLESVNSTLNIPVLDGLPLTQVGG